MKLERVWPSLAWLSEKKKTKTCALECAEPAVCPLNQLARGKTGRIKRLASTPELNRRLRELGIFEDQHVKMVGRPSNIICQVCNTRLALSDELGELIWVEPLATPRPPAAK